jgi:hypothetical protein
MTDTIQKIIEKIRSKSIEINNQLIKEREKNTTLESENVSLKAQLTGMADALKVLNVEMSELKIALETAKNQVVETPISKNRKEEEIDELVKEIEYCISQLKK